MDNEHVPNSDGVKPHLEASCFLCLELFFGTGNLTYAMRHFSPDSFCVDHKVTKQLVEIVCLDLSKEDRQILVEQWAPFFFRANVSGFFLEGQVARLQGHVAEGPAGVFMVLHHLDHHVFRWSSRSQAFTCD